MASRRRSSLAALAVLTALVLAACAPPPLPPPAGWEQHDLTPDGADTLELRLSTVDAGRVVAGRWNTGRNSRTVFTRRADVDSVDHEVCVRFANSGGIAQEGVALRVRHDDGRTRAVTVTKNVWMLANWNFNVHTWDTARPGRMVLHDALDLSSSLGRGSQGAQTWNLCARAVGERVDVRAWRAGDPEPDWEHPSVRSATIPVEFTAAGRPGWYVGHVERGHWADLSDMRATVLDPAET